MRRYGNTPSESFGPEEVAAAAGSADAGLTKSQDGQDQAGRRPDDSSDGCPVPLGLVVEAPVNALQMPFDAVQHLVVRVQPRIDRLPEPADLRGENLDIGLGRVFNRPPLLCGPAHVRHDNLFADPHSGDTPSGSEGDSSRGRRPRVSCPPDPPVGVAVTKVGEGKDPRGGCRAGFKGKTTLNRSDFGAGMSLGPASESMELLPLVEGIRKWAGLRRMRKAISRRNGRDHYGVVSIAFHWTVALGFAGLIGLGAWMVELT